MLGPDLVALIAVIGTTLSGILTTVFTSRCSEIRCCCMHCIREVLPAPDVTGREIIPPKDVAVHHAVEIDQNELR